MRDFRDRHVVQRNNPFRFAMLCAIVAAIAFAPPRLTAGEPDDTALSLEQIMADHDWIGRPPESPYFSDDGRSIYFRQKRIGQEERDLVEIGLDGRVLRTVSDADRGRVDSNSGDVNNGRRRKVYSLHGDLFLKNLEQGDVRQLTRTVEAETAPQFLWGDDRIMFHRGGRVVIRDLVEGLEFEPAELRFEKDPLEVDAEKKKKEPFLARQQEALFDVLREREQKQDAGRKRARKQREADATQVPVPWYLGDSDELVASSLSPDGRWMLLRVAEKSRESDRRDTMPKYVTGTGYVDTQRVRPKVGVPKPRDERLWLLDLAEHTRNQLDLAVLPEIAIDPLAALREEAKHNATKGAKEKSSQERANETDAAERPTDRHTGERESGEVPVRDDRTADAKQAPGQAPDSVDEKRSEDSNHEPKPRPVSVAGIEWSRDGAHCAVQIFSADHKDRWLAAVDLEERCLTPLEHFHDEAWINRRFAQVGWLDDRRTLYFTSEATGYGHLYFRTMPGGATRAMTSGEYEVSNLTPSRDGRWLYFTANRDHPGVYETYRLDVRDGTIEQITRLGGENEFALSPDGLHLAILHSTTTRPPELYVQPAEPGAAAKRLTHTVSEAFTAIDWVEPEIVAIPSRAGRPIYARLYLPDEPSGATDSLRDKRRRAVVFIHGAGYLQNAHAGWSHYFREFMFHTLLARRGYVVLDMDYRASAGYGRDWRTAIYRHMGTSELEDLADGVAWLVAEQGVDSHRVGVYGGSYGGFLTLMAMFRRPELFACGAALRPVTDWAHYNDGYTSNILNTPQLDPEAYANSSPIQFAEGLAGPLLICHGMVDDNVLFQDTVRLVQRLIELKKENWEVALYPVESHGFEEPTSWLDEYRRILRLFEEHLR